MRLPSGRFVIRMPGALHRRLKEEALRAGQSLNQLCVARLQAHGLFPSATGTAANHAGLISAELLEGIVRIWQEDLVGLVLFGSAARGDDTGDSDIDLLLVMKPEIRIARGLYRDWEESFRESANTTDLERISPHFITLPASVRDAGGLWYEAALDGAVLWERDRLVSRFLGSVREAMGQGKIRRRMLHGSPYWIKEFEDTDA